MSDYNFLMESRLSPQQLQVVNQLGRVAADQGLNLYLVGGAVRDLTYGQQVIRDLDFSLEGNAQKILRFFHSARRRRTRLHRSQTAESVPELLETDQVRFDSRLGSAEVIFSNHIRAEIAAGRNEVYPKPGRRPEILPAMIFEDLKRRDFSVNAMAVSLHPNSRGLLLDPTNGAADIEKHELRVLSRSSFLEDPARIYRLLRLALRLDFKPEERTKTLLGSALDNRAWERMDPERQGRELRAILQEENPARVLKMLAERGLLAGLDRKIAAARVPRKQFAKIRSALRAVPGADGFFLNFLCLVEKFGGGQRNRLAKKIIAHRKGIKLALGLEGAARKLARVLRSSKAASPSRVYALLSEQPQHLLLFLLANYPQAKIQRRVKNFLFKYPLVRSRLPRAELLALGMEPGSKFEKILARLFLDQLDGKIKTHQQLLKEFRKLAGIKEPAPKPSKPSHGKKSGRRGKKT